MSVTAGFGTLDWLPAGVLARQERETRAEERQARQEQAEQEAAAEQAHDRAVAAYMGAALARGEDVGAADVIAGNTGRTLDDVLAGASGELADRIPVGQRGERDYDELIVLGQTVQRSHRGASGDYEIGRLLDQAGQLHRDLIATRARYDYPAAEARARAKSTAELERAEYREYGYYPDIVR